MDKIIVRGFMKSIGILYIATGKYEVFWEAFYKSFEKFFLKNTEKHYYVFTDKKNIYAEDNSQVHKIFQKEQPWPIPTLLKFHYFLEIEEELLRHDYLYQSNGPIICVGEVSEADFLPRDEYDEKLFYTQHPGYYDKKTCYAPYDRNKKSHAYVPYNQGNVYVFGAMNGGKAKNYIEMCKQLDYQICEDLKLGIIAKCHDESHINNYVAKLENYRLLSMSYAYPSGFEVPCEPIIRCLDKSKYFDVNMLKGIYIQTTTEKSNFNYSIERIVRKIRAVILKRLKKIGFPILALRDRLLCRKVRSVEWKSR